MANDKEQVAKRTVDGVPITITRTDTSGQQNGIISGDPMRYDYEVQIGKDKMIIDSPGIFVGKTKVTINGQELKDENMVKALQTAVADASYHPVTVGGNLSRMTGLSKMGISLGEIENMTQSEGHGLLEQFKVAKSALGKH